MSTFPKTMAITRTINSLGLQPEEPTNALGYSRLPRKPSPIGVFFGCFARNIDGDPWFTWWFILIYQGNPSISPKMTPMPSPFPFARRWRRRRPRSSLEAIPSQPLRSWPGQVSSVATAELLGLLLPGKKEV